MDEFIDMYLNIPDCSQMDSLVSVEMQSHGHAYDHVTIAKPKSKVRVPMKIRKIY